MPEDITVTVDDGHLARVGDVADELRAAGMHIEQVLGEIGVITGTVTADLRSTMARIEGVASIAGQDEFLLPPPDSEVQ